MVDIDELTYDVREKRVYYQGSGLNSQFFGPTLAGYCEKCEGCVNSEVCCECEGQHVVVGRCEACGRVVLLVFDGDWEVMGERVVEGSSLVSDVSDFKSIPYKYLDAVFTPAEIEAMKNKYNNKKYSRQNLYRARKKYEKFKLLFNIELDI